MTLYFAEPLFLILLVLLPIAWYQARRIRISAGSRRWAILAVRSLLLLFLILALAQPHLRRQAEELTVLYLVDVSDSVPPNLRERSLTLVQELSEQMTNKDEAGLIVFGENPSIESTPVKNFQFDGKIRSAVGGTRTDIAYALRLALSEFPVDRMKRIVLMSDGNENSGSSLEAARYARNNGIPIDVIPLRYDARGDLRIEKVVVPQQIAKNTPFDVKVFMESEQDTTGILRIFEDGQLIEEEQVTVRAGKNPPLILQRRLEEGGFHTYKATIEAPGDARPQNNIAQSFTYLESEPRVLYVEGDRTLDRYYLAEALKAEDIIVEVTDPLGLPINVEELQRYDSLILSNVPAFDMSESQMKMIERAVHDLGIGLVAIGGDNSFGAGGYQDTPLEEALPLTMDIKQKKVLPNGALALILHTCEIPSGNDWARSIAQAALDTLSSRDYLGLLYFGSAPGMASGGGFGGWGYHYLWDPGMQQVGDKIMMRTAIKGVTPGDMPDFDTTLKMAYDSLKPLKTQVKHVIVITDGDANPPSRQFVKNMFADGITLSTVAIAPHVEDLVKGLDQIAFWGGGNFYYPKNFDELPRIFIKEASIVRKALIHEEPFEPRLDTPTEILMGIGAMPQLNGYVATSIKDLATLGMVTDKDDPLLAHWRYGLGKSLAFTSDAKNKWAANWLAWDGYAKFWSQAIRWSLRETGDVNLQVNTELRGGTGYVSVDAIDEAGNFRNFLDFEGAVFGPEFERIPLNIQQVAPGRYEGTFDANNVGTYMLSMASGEGEERQFVTSGVSLSYSPEYETSQSADAFLEDLADQSGGIVAGQDYNPFSHDLEHRERQLPIWPWLLLAAALLLPADVFARRVYLDWGEMRDWVVAKIRPRRSAEEQKEVMESLFAAKRRAAKEREEEKEEAEARADFRERLARQEAHDRAGEKIFASDEDPKKAPAHHPSKQTVSADTGSERQHPEPKEGGDFTGSLLEAKRRAKKRKK